MPNWCNNNISIVGNIETIKQLWEDANQEGEAGGLLNAMVPMPKELSETTKGSGDELQTEKYDGFTNWYDWAVNRWGTKWDVSLEGLEFIDHEDGTASIQGWFESAWAPPIGAYEKFCDDMDGCDLEASYHEPGMDFAGFWTASGGDEYLANLHEEFKLPEDERSDLYKRLDDEYNLSENYDMWDEDEEVL
jgi:hypothetical protein